MENKKPQKKLLPPYLMLALIALIAAVVLMFFGTGSIKGFAITLLISVLASLFTAVVVTRWLLKLICGLDVRKLSAYTR